MFNNHLIYSCFEGGDIERRKEDGRGEERDTMSVVIVVAGRVMMIGAVCACTAQRLGERLPQLLLPSKSLRKRAAGARPKSCLSYCILLFGHLIHHLLSKNGELNFI